MPKQTKSKGLGKTTSYQSVDASDDEDCGDIEMEERYSMPSRLSRSQTAETSDPQIIRAFSEIRFKQHQSAIKIKRRLKKKTINKKQAKQELKAAYRTLAHTYDKQELALEYDANLTDGLNQEQIDSLHEEIGYNELTPPFVFSCYLSPLYLIHYSHIYSVNAILNGYDS